ncbi:hypothetical protein P6144_09980 [Sphingomonas sp. HITSZ_GF]|uniref:hypothetical protein n=1 Tax=Sphingomonas sp. HITSZ_GF TaxID=3037247 RepID=UPI00240D715B|nr:hypothetical protein [Sphingomonas sp. HITSZ_GF]MDG2533974.1 hypothetical protein [Sphingomonas sp. HITSZ_GF]
MSDDLNKLLAKRAVERIDRQSAFISAEFGTISRWLTASLFALNGGGAAALINSHEKASTSLLPVSLFGAGVVFAMFGAMTIQGMYGTLADLLMRQDAYWSRVAISGRRLKWVEARFRASRRRRYRYAWIAPSLGWISGALFVSGIAAISL